MISGIQALRTIANGCVLVNIGQLDQRTKKALASLVKRGRLVKWKGHWFPLDGHPTYGMGPLKTCYAKRNPWAEAAS